MYDLVNKLVEYFKDNDFLWKLDTGYIQPDESDMEKFLLYATSRLKDVGDSIEVGRLIIKKKEVGYDVYGYFGEFV